MLPNKYQNKCKNCLGSAKVYLIGTWTTKIDRILITSSDLDQCNRSAWRTRECDRKCVLCLKEDTISLDCWHLKNYHVYIKYIFTDYSGNNKCVFPQDSNYFPRLHIYILTLNPSISSSSMFSDTWTPESLWNNFS